MQKEIPGFYYDPVKKRYFKGSAPRAEPTIQDTAPLPKEQPISIPQYVRSQRIRPNRNYDPIARFSQVQSEMRLPPSVQDVKKISFSRCGKTCISLSKFGQARVIPLQKFKTSDIDETKSFRFYDAVTNEQPVCDADFDFVPGQVGGMMTAMALTPCHSVRQSSSFIGVCRFDDDGNESVVSYNVGGEGGSYADIKFISESKLVYTTGRTTFLAENVERPFYMEKTRRDNPTLIRRQTQNSRYPFESCNSTIIAVTTDPAIRETHSGGKMVAEAFTDGFIRLWDVSNGNQPFFQTIAMPPQCRASSMHIENFNLTVAFYGPQAKLCTYDLRSSTVVPILTAPIFNENKKQLKHTASECGRYIAFPNQCGTIRLYESRNLRPFADFKSDRFDRTDDQDFIPGAAFCGQRLFSTTRSGFGSLEQFNLILNHQHSFLFRMDDPTEEEIVSFEESGKEIMILDGDFGTPAKGLFRDADGDVFYVAVKDAEGRLPTGDSLFCNLVGIFGVDDSLPKAISAEEWMTLSLEEYVFSKSSPKSLTHVNFAYDSWNGLEHIHTVFGKVHGRIHPRNILALDTGFSGWLVKISDLDVTRPLSNYGKEWTIHQTEGNHQEGEKDDLKSWATSMIFMITGESIHWQRSSDTHHSRCQKMKESSRKKETSWRPEIVQKLSSYNRKTADKLLKLLESGIPVQFDFLDEFKSH
ncbi:Oidioi.mRNA.OKI2018_I69.XSR.g16965.t3.cds [Oikopleura dioica]|uniref:Oidioi.mRNA.OKI2018_I69.XSR.g16965.t3.cds n=1 Tax=Oikopleura dioica TaxID=34765 RepID=A0ABN7SLL6_OIKDI|nr:Oidioi.mRNA.OKI2018_I69.XSR.g16965.t3.cds [Oikopleura dioica]